MLVVCEGVMNTHGRLVNAAYTEIMLIPAISSRCRPESQGVLHQPCLSKNKWQVVLFMKMMSSKYLGDGECDRDVIARRGQTWGVFEGSVEQPLPQTGG